MAIPNVNYSEIISTTLDTYSDEFNDNVLNHNPLLARLNKKGNVRSANGGVKILENLMYADNGKL
jgi:hypothetical protein